MYLDLLICFSAVIHRLDSVEEIDVAWIGGLSRDFFFFLSNSRIYSASSGPVFIFPISVMSKIMSEFML